MQAYFVCQIMLQIMKADKKEGKSKLNTASVIYLIYSNEDFILHPIS